MLHALEGGRGSKILPCLVIRKMWLKFIYFLLNCKCLLHVPLLNTKLYYNTSGPAISNKFINVCYFFDMICFAWSYQIYVYCFEVGPGEHIALKFFLFHNAYNLISLCYCYLFVRDIYRYHAQLKSYCSFFNLTLTFICLQSHDTLYLIMRNVFCFK